MELLVNVLTNKRCTFIKLINKQLNTWNKVANEICEPLEEWHSAQQGCSKIRCAEQMFELDYQEFTYSIWVMEISEKHEDH